MDLRAAIERRLSLAAIGIALFAFGVLLLALPPFFQSFDEAKYVGIGRNLLAGRGIVTIDGTPFLVHSPLWSVAIVAPASLFGASPLDWGHFFDGLAGLGFVALVAAFGWRVRPAVGALAAAVVVGFVYVHDLSRTARLDVPAATLILAALATGLRAVDRRSSLWAALAGIAFGLAGLVKEIVLPFLPVPFLVALLRGLRLRTVVRLSGWIALTALSTTAWWFVVVAGYTGEVYRLGLPAATLGPLGLLSFGAAVAAIGVDRLAELVASRGRFGALLGARRGRPARVGERPQGRTGVDAADVARGPLGRGGEADGREGEADVREGPEAPPVASSRRRLLVAAGALAWFVLQLLFYARNPEARLPNLLELGQLRTYVATWAPALGLVAGFIGGGLAILALRLALEARAAGRQEAEVAFGGGASVAEGTALAELAIAIVCGVPLVVLVAALGEPPRNYLAQIGLAVALAAGGWIWLAEAIAGRGVLAWLGAGVVTGLAAALAFVALRVAPVLAVGAALAGGVLTAGLGRLLFERLDVLRRSWPVVTAVVAAVLFASALTVYAVGHRESGSGRARAEVVASVVRWVRSNLPPGSTVALGSLLGYEIGNELVGDYRVVRITQTSLRVDPAAPLGIATVGGGGVDDWIAVDPAPRNTTELTGFRAATVLDRLRRTGAAAWVYVVGTDTAAPTLLAALTPEHGFFEVAHLAVPTTPTAPPIEAFVFRVDQGRLALPADHLYVSPVALERLVRGLAAVHPAPRAVAARLLERVVVVPGGTEGSLLEALRALAEGGAGSP